MTTNATTRRTTAKKTTAKKTTAKRATAAKPQARKDEGVRPGKQGMLAHVPVPHVSVPHVALPRLSAPHGPRPSVRLPVTGRRGQVLWLGGLAVVAAFGVIDWPVAGAIAVGTYVAEQRSKAAKGRTNGPTPDKPGTESGSERTVA